MPGQPGLAAEDRDHVPNGRGSDEPEPAGRANGRPGTQHLLERVLERANLQQAWKRVRRNGGSPGIDGMSVEDARTYLKTAWPRIREDLFAERYQPAAVRRVDIPKPGGGKRELGIPTVVDRLIQQAMLQVLGPLFDADFSEHSHGFRPGRSAHDAIREARGYVQDGKRWVVDVDLERFFDRVNHDVLMGRLAGRIADKRVLRLIRRYLEAGVMCHGVAVERQAGTPQGGPLSPLLANVLLDEVDKELETRGHSFVRYADDCQVYVATKRAGERVMAVMQRLYGRLRLRVNESKSAVVHAKDCRYLGYAFWWSRGGRVELRVTKEALARMKARVRELTSRNRGAALRTVVSELSVFLRGWKQYFQLARTPKVMARLDQWIARRLRMLKLKQWKRGRTAYRELRRLGVAEDVAASAAVGVRRWWRTALHPGAQAALPTAHFAQMGLVRLGP